MSSYLLIAISLLLAGTAKGVFGMGLPAVSLGLLSLLMPPVEAATLIVIPTLTTNAWQFLTGPRRLAMSRRFAALLIGVVVGTTLGIRVLTGWNTSAVSLTLGVVLLVYAFVGILASHWTIRPAAERWSSPLIGLITGIINGATGVSVMPLVPYLNSLGLQRDELIQAMGLVFMTAIVALASCLAVTGHLQIASAGASALALIPVFIGMYAGQTIRTRLHANDFRRWFFVGLFALGGYSVARALLQM
jgi:uncharacterized protein